MFARSRGSFAFVLGFVLLATPLVSVAQSYSRPSYGDERFRPLRSPRRGPEPPPLEFEALSSVPLPAPLADDRLVPADGAAVRVLLTDGWRTVHLDEGGVVPWDAPPDATIRPPDSWVVGGRRGKLRFRVDPDGRIRAQRRCRLGGSDGHRPKWTLRLPGRPAGPPLVDDARLYVGSSDSRVYALRARNGHRLWARDVGARVTRPLALWSGSVGDSPDVRLVLVVGDVGAALSALDPHDGSTLAEYRPPGDRDRIVSAPEVLADGRIVLVRQGWRTDDLELVVLRPAPEEREDPGDAPDDQRTTTKTSPARISRPSRARTSTTSASAGKPGPPYWI